MPEHRSGVPLDALFVAADEPLLVFSSAVAAAISLEAVDVRDGVYGPAYGPAGEPYQIGTQGEVVLVERTDDPARPGHLAALLRRYLAALDFPAVGTMTLPELIEEVWSRGVDD